VGEKEQALQRRIKRHLQKQFVRLSGAFRITITRGESDSWRRGFEKHREECVNGSENANPESIRVGQCDIQKVREGRNDCRDPNNTLVVIEQRSRSQTVPI